MAAKYILDQLTLDDKDVDMMVETLGDTLELLGSLKVAESAFSDWDNDEDSVYDHI